MSLESAGGMQRMAGMVHARKARRRLSASEAQCEPNVPVSSSMSLHDTRNKS